VGAVRCGPGAPAGGGAGRGGECDSGRIQCPQKGVLEACHFLIDELKASVPIWKKEVYDEGHAAEWKANKEFTGEPPAAE